MGGLFWTLVRHCVNCKFGLQGIFLGHRGRSPTRSWHVSGDLQHDASISFGSVQLRAVLVLGCHLWLETHFRVIH